VDNSEGCGQLAGEIAQGAALVVLDEEDDEDDEPAEEDEVDDEPAEEGALVEPLLELEDSEDFEDVAPEEDESELLVPAFALVLLSDSDRLSVR
jgi:hypothetical protein